MPVERFYIDTSLEDKQVITFEGEEFHHLAHVLRIRPKETIEVINGRGYLAFIYIESVEKNKATGKVTSVSYTPAPPYSLILAQAIPRQPRLEYIIEKAVELGITELWLFPGRYSEKTTFSSSGKDRVFHIISSAMKQCGRLHIPKVVFLPNIEKWSTPLPKSSFFGDTRKEAPPFILSLTRQNPSSILLTIGPEKGFHAEETLYMQEKLLMQGIHLHSNILRTDTAAICGLSLASYYLENQPNFC